jgi:hypothetical protein
MNRIVWVSCGPALQLSWWLFTELFRIGRWLSRSDVQTRGVHLSNTLRSNFRVKSPMPLLPLSTACSVGTLFKQIISAHVHINHTNIDSKCMACVQCLQLYLHGVYQSSCNTLLSLQPFICMKSLFYLTIKDCHYLSAVCLIKVVYVAESPKGGGIWKW